jgi:hypothetical protein
VYQGNVFQELQFPQSSSTFAIGVNDLGEVSGYFEEELTGALHGFIWTPPAASDGNPQHQSSTVIPH